MTADYTTALWAFPFFILLFQEFGEGAILDEVEVFNHAHPKVISIPCVNPF